MRARRQSSSRRATRVSDRRRASAASASPRTMEDDLIVARPAYAPAYVEAVARARALMSELERDDGEPSTSGATWTWREGAAAAAAVVDGCGAHYTAWWFRWTCVRGMVREATTVEARSEILGAELDFVERETTRNAKNYQVWNHARSILSAALENGCFEAVRARAYEHVERALEEDAKNIHAWSHRAWLTRATDSWSDECAYTRRLLEDDRMNNSAWNARFHATTRLLERGDVGVLERETEFALERLRFDDANESAWNYLRGLCDLAETREVDEDIARRVVRAAVDAARECVRDPAAVAAAPSRHAALFVADRLAFAAARDADASIAADAERMFHRLVSLDPVRGNYYRARVDRLRAALAL